MPLNSLNFNNFPPLLQNYLKTFFHFEDKEVNTTALFSSIAAITGNSIRIKIKNRALIYPNLQTALISSSGNGRTPYIQQNQLSLTEEPYKTQTGQLLSIYGSFDKIKHLRDYTKTNNGNIYINADSILTRLFTKIPVTRLDFFRKGISGGDYYYNNDQYFIKNFCVNIIGSANPLNFQKMLKSKECNNLNFYFLNYCKWDFKLPSYFLEKLTEEECKKKHKTQNEIKLLIRQSIEHCKGNVFNLTPEAYELFFDYESQINTLLRLKKKHIISNFLINAPQFVLKIAFIFHVLSLSSLKPCLISAENLKSAIEYAQHKIFSINQLLENKNLK
jgi:hypothetical protein